MTRASFRPGGLSLRKFSRSIPVQAKATPSKAHLFAPLPASSFPKGYAITAVHCGIKKHKDTSAPPPLDLGILISTSPFPTSAAACFTRNVFKAAPVLVSEEILNTNQGRAKALVVNSGCANAVTGKQGMANAWSMARATDTLIPEPSSTSQTLVLSTGVIGQQLPIDKILQSIASFTPPSASSQSSAPDQSALPLTSSFGSTFEAWASLARAFMTTDTFPKLRSRVFEINGTPIRIAGIDKGAGMIHPDMGPPRANRPLHATLLGLIATDAAVSPRSLQTALSYAVDRSFNSIDVDGDMSTNDTVILLANGAAALQTDSFAKPSASTPSGIDSTVHEGQTLPPSGSHMPEIDEATDPAAYAVFRNELTAFAIELAQLVVRDGEGATKFITVTVEEAPTYADAHKIASTISTSSLVKTALYGEDANWGRILAAVGYAPTPTRQLVPTSDGNAAETTSFINPSKVSVSLLPKDGGSEFPLLVNGEPHPNIDEVRAKEILSTTDIEIRVRLGAGDERAQYWTCDLSHEYVTINGDYRS